jgi:hypothetical protein
MSSYKLPDYRNLDRAVDLLEQVQLDLSPNQNVLGDVALRAMLAEALQLVRDEARNLQNERYLGK